MTKFMMSPEQLGVIFQCGVYSIHHINKPNVLYVGSASKVRHRNHISGMYARWNAHLYCFRKGNHHSNYLQNVVNKYGIEGLRFSVLEVCSPEECLQREQYYIDTLQPAYNTCKIAGNSKGYKHSEATIALMISQRRGKKGHSHSIEARQAMSEAAKLRDMSHLRSPEVSRKKSEMMKGKSLPQSVYDKIKVPVYQYNKAGELINNYPSIQAAADELNIDRASISKCVSGKRVTAGGFMWTRSINK